MRRGLYELKEKKYSDKKTLTFGGDSVEKMTERGERRGEVVYKESRNTGKNGYRKHPVLDIIDQSSHNEITYL